MARVLTENSVVHCGHLGNVETTGTTKLTVQGSPVVLPSGIVGATVTVGTCQTVPSNSATKCSKVATLTGGLAGKLSVGGQPVALETIAGQGTTVGNPVGQLGATATQTKLLAQ